MNITFGKKEFLRIVSLCHGVVPKNWALGILSHVRLTASAEGVAVDATDLYIGLRAKLDCGTGDAPGHCQVKTPGCVAIPVKELVERVKAMPDGTVKLVVDGDKMTLSAAGSSRRFSMVVLSGEDFPAVPAPTDAAKTAQISTALLATLLDRAKASAEVTEDRPYLNAVSLDWTGERVRAVATDGRRLSFAFGSAEHFDMSALLSLRAVNELRRVIDASVGQTVAVQDSKNDVFFTLGSTVFSARKVNETFPPVNAFLKPPHKRKAAVDRVALIDAANAVRLSAGEKMGGVTFTFADGRLTLKAQSPDGGDGYDEVASSYAGPKQDIGLNPRYLTDALRSVECEKVELLFDGELDPVYIRPVGSDEFLGVVMPMRI